VVDPEQVLRAAREAELLRLCDLLSLEELTARPPRRAGITAIKAPLAAGGRRSKVTRSELEDRFVRFLKCAGLPPAEIDVPLDVGGRELEVDCLWRERRLVVERTDTPPTGPGRRSNEIGSVIGSSRPPVAA
jgi:hypothetical protein